MPDKKKDDEEEKEDSEIEGLLGDIPKEEYPKKLLDERREKFRKQIRDHNKKVEKDENDD